MTAPIGFAVIDKPAGITSHTCVARIRRVLGIRRVGHGGTLDPAVTGVLPIAVGQATRLLPYLPGEKTYRGVIQLGITTNTDDLQGDELSRQSVPDLSSETLDQALSRFLGAISQQPPQVSAVHVDGERAYARARRGEQMELAARPVTIHQLRLLGWSAAQARLSVEVHCSAGTYIRSLARDLGAALGCGGCLASLRRTQALGFHDNQAVALPAAADEVGKGEMTLMRPELALPHLPKRLLSASEQLDWSCGRRIAPGISGAADAVVVLSDGGRMLGLGVPDGEDGLKPKVVFEARG
ncbi:tRNA pseudouridine(55) synthase [Synechococcus sp. BIOS-E4-1]|nr:tRNA pseudouridine(55) synthase [Synechococcus sp. BIOS-E4-1]